MTSPLPLILSDPETRAAWIAWRVRLHARRLRNAARASFRSCRGTA